MEGLHVLQYFFDEVVVLLCQVWYVDSELCQKIRTTCIRYIMYARTSHVMLPAKESSFDDHEFLALSHSVTLFSSDHSHA